jgi:hypothetical protein
MSMGKGKKIAIGCLIALVVACLISAAVMVVGGAWVKSKVGGLMGGFMDTGKNAQAIQKLDQTYPFTAPADGQVTEDRLVAYIAVCAKAKPIADQFRDFEKTKSGENKGDMKAVSDAAKLMGDLTGAIRQGLEEQKMGPREYHFIGGQMRMAAGTAPEEGGGQPLGEAQRQTKETMLKNLEGLLATPNLPQAQREEIQGQVDQIKGELGQSQPANPNQALYLKYKDRLKQVDLQGLEGVAFQQNTVKS